MVPLKILMGPLSLALASSLAVERLLEFIQNVMETWIGSTRGRQMPVAHQRRKSVDQVLMTAEAGLQRERIEATAEARREDRARMLKDLNAAREALQAATEAGPQTEIVKRMRELEARLAEDESEGELKEGLSPATVLHADATDPDDGTTLKAFAVQMLGFVAGILLARGAGIQLFHGLLGALQGPDPTTGNLPVSISEGLDYILTGLFIGGGSKPAHLLIRFITERKVAAAPEPAAEPIPAPTAATGAAAGPSAPAVPTAAVVVSPGAVGEPDWLPIPYDGGVQAERLESLHRRPGNPNLIVYHHTAMNSASSFEDLVRVIQARTDEKGNPWVTGYHCVIMGDGTVRPFCRWDRYGCHAAGHNRLSLGISFNGNFESDPRVPFANPAGRLGALRPSEAQLRSGARVVALWTHLYGIAPQFGTTIIPHRQISSKTCPGSRFPYDEFQKWVEWYRGRWADSAAIHEQIAAFKLKPYLYA